MKNVIDYLSGEFFLDFMPNGGKAVLIRTAWVSSLIYLSAIAIKSYCSGGVLFSLSLAEFKKEVAETLPWLGAILGGSYAALYSRFSSQWAYIADLYNQQMALASSLPEEQISWENYHAWQAAFIEDAICMHLETKDGFRNAIYEMLQNQEVKVLLNEHVSEKKIMSIEKNLKKILSK